MGRLTRDPVIRTTGNGKTVAQFTVAVESGYGDNKKTDFISCVAWNSQAEFLSKYFTKGMMVIVSGRISTRTWEDQSGKKNYVTEVVANEVSFGETRKQREQERQAEQSAVDEEFTPLGEEDDDLPFQRRFVGTWRR